MAAENFDTHLWRSTLRPEMVDEGYETPKRESKTLPAGWRLTDKHAPFLVDTLWERNVEVKMRDGCKIYVDIFRPRDAAAGSVPAIITWSPYGKSACHTGGSFSCHGFFQEKSC